MQNTEHFSEDFHLILFGPTWTKIMQVIALPWDFQGQLLLKLGKQKRCMNSKQL